MNNLIINVLGQWWRIYVKTPINHNMPLQLMYHCNVVYDCTNKFMIKNRHGDAILNDAIVLKMWLGEELAVFEWNGYVDFQRKLEQYSKTLAD